MPHSPFRFPLRFRLLPALFAALALHGLSSSAQTVPVEPTNSAGASNNDEGPIGIIPIVKGPNFSFATTSQHDSDAGWSSLLSPNFAWRFNRHFAADVTLPIFDYINILATEGTKALPIYVPQTKHFALGDTALNTHAEFSPRLVTYSLAVSLGMPSGNTNYGLGAGQVTYTINNHFEKSFEWFNPDIEVGIGDTSGLFDTRVRKSYQTVGTVANFRAGASFDLPFKLSFDAEAYEEMPVAAQTLYSTTGKGKKKKTTETGKSLGEDNGFETSLDIPLNPHVTLTGFYDRSLRSHIDTVGFSFTYLFKAPPPASTR